MATTAKKAKKSVLQESKSQRRLRLARHFIDVVAPLLESGESYSDLSVERLITEVGVSRSTFYSYFSDKAALLAAMAEDVTIDLIEAGTSWFELHEPAGPVDVRDALRPLFLVYRKHRGILRSITDAAPYDAGIADMQRTLVARATQELRAHLEGLDSMAVDVDRTSAWLVLMLERGLYQLVAPADEDEVDALLDAAAALVWQVAYAER